MIIGAFGLSGGTPAYGGEEPLAWVVGGGEAQLNDSVVQSRECFPVDARRSDAGWLLNCVSPRPVEATWPPTEL